MSKRLLYTVAFLLFYAFAAFAQEGEETVPVITEDTVFISPESEDGGEFEEADPAALRIASRKADSSLVAELRSDEDLTYERTEPVKKKEPRDSPDNIAVNPWLKNLLWGIIILVFLAIVIAFLYRSNAGMFGKRAKKEEAPEEFSESGDNIFDINYESEIRNAIGAGKYPLAVRLLYLQTLKNLSQRELIEYRQERTNGDYIFQLFNSPYYKSFFSLTRHYEYVWYGKFPVSPAAFQAMQTEFTEFNRRLPS